MNGINAKDAGSAPTSSNAIPHPASLMLRTAANNPAGSSTSARSVISITTCNRSWARSRTDCRAPGHGARNQRGSALMNNGTEEGSPRSMAPLIAAA